MKITLEKVLANSLFLAVLFPYVSPISTPFDTQPSAIIIAGVMFLLYLSRKKDNMPRIMLLLLFLFFDSLVVTMLFSSDMMSGIRSLVGYFTLFLVTFSAYHSFRLIKPTLLIKASWVWLFFGMVQMFVTRSFGSFILPRMSTSSVRGVVSLAVEPSYYAIVMVFMLLLNEFFFAKEYFDKKQYKRMIILSIFQIVISFSGMGFLFLVVFAIAKAISAIVTQSFSRKFKSLISVMISLFVILSAFTFIPILVQSRAGALLKSFIISPSSVILYDYSIAQRLSHILISAFSIFQNYGLGFGVGEFEIKVQEVISELPTPILNMFITQRIDPGGRIMSGWGSSIFELGVIGLIPMVVFIVITFKARKSHIRNIYMTYFLVVFFLMWMAVPYSFPIFSYSLGMVMYFLYEDKSFEKENQFLLYKISD